MINATHGGALFLVGSFRTRWLDGAHPGPTDDETRGGDGPFGSVPKWAPHAAFIEGQCRADCILLKSIPVHGAHSVMCQFMGPTQLCVLDN